MRDDVQGGRLADVADVRLVGHAEQVDTRAVDRLLHRVQRVGHAFDHECRIDELTCPASSMKRASKPFCRAFHDR